MSQPLRWVHPRECQSQTAPPQAGEALPGQECAPLKLHLEGDLTRSDMQ